MIPGKRYTPELLLSIAWRRKWLILIPTVLVAVVACGITYFLPDKFRSETAILVVPQRVPENYVKSAVTTKIEDRLRSINQQVRSRTRLERIIEDFNLYPERRKRDIMQDIVDDMSDAIDVEIVQGDVFRIAFSSDNPRTAMQVTERLGTFFIDESLKDRTALAEQAGEFLETQVSDTERKLRETEQKVAEYKKKHDGELPTQADANQQGLSTTQFQLQNVQMARDRDLEIQANFQRDLQEFTKIGEEVAALPPSPSQDAPQSKAAELEKQRAQVKALQARYTSANPQLAAAEAKLATLEREVAEEAASQTALGGTAPVSQSQLRLNAAIATTQRQLEAVGRRIEKADADIRTLRAKIGEYQRRIEAAPLRDSELVELTRDYQVQREAYDNLSAKRLDSQVSANLERRQIGEQFRILDPARLPERPASPNRDRLYMLSIILALAVGFGSAAGAEYLDRGLRSEDDVRLALALPVLATIPVIGGTKKMTLRRKLLAGSAAAVVVTVMAGAAWIVLR